MYAAYHAEIRVPTLIVAIVEKVAFALGVFLSPFHRRPTVFVMALADAGKGERGERRERERASARITIVRVPGASSPILRFRHRPFFGFACATTLRPGSPILRFRHRPFFGFACATTLRLGSLPAPACVGHTCVSSGQGGKPSPLLGKIALASASPKRF
jgi:hypothetical protein